MHGQQGLGEECQWPQAGSTPVCLRERVREGGRGERSEGGEERQRRKGNGREYLIISTIEGRKEEVR